MLECPRCHEKSEDGRRFCADCGAPLDPAFEELKKYSEQTIRDSLRTILSSDYKDQNYLEIKTAQLIVERLTGWGKLFATLVAIPLALLLLTLTILGIKQYSGFTTQVRNVQADVEAKIHVAQDTVAKLQAEGTTVSSEYKKLAEDLSTSKNLATEVHSLTAQYNQLAEGLQETAVLSEKLKNIDTKVTGITKSLNYLLSIGNANYTSLQPLQTPEKDAKDVSNMFLKLGYSTNKYVTKRHARGNR
jgi:hypothetical protein